MSPSAVRVVEFVPDDTLDEPKDEDKNNDDGGDEPPWVTRDQAFEGDHLSVDILKEYEVDRQKWRSEATLTLANRSIMFSECLYGIVPAKIPLRAE